MPPKGKPAIKVPNFNNLGVVIDPPLSSKEVVEGYMQALSRLLAWNENEQRFDFLTMDTEGRLHVASDQAKVTTATHSQATVTTTSQTVILDSPTRKGLLLFNNDVVPVYFTLSKLATVATGMLLNPGVAYENNVWFKWVSMITASSTADVRILELS